MIRLHHALSLAFVVTFALGTAPRLLGQDPPTTLEVDPVEDEQATQDRLVAAVKELNTAEATLKNEQKTFDFLNSLTPKPTELVELAQRRLDTAKTAVTTLETEIADLKKRLAAYKVQEAVDKLDATIAAVQQKIDGFNGSLEAAYTAYKECTESKEKITQLQNIIRNSRRLIPQIRRLARLNARKAKLGQPAPAGTPRPRRGSTGF
jgi:chromosome segregation ATPase